MNILAFDTCLGACSVAVGLDAGGALEKVETLYEEMATGHAERLMPMIEMAMRNAGIGFAELSRIAVTTGPGTFTGTRIGIAAARALALATSTATVGISSLEVMAQEAARALPAAQRDGHLIVAVDAHRGQVYAQVFSRRDYSSLSPPRLLTVAEAAALARGAATTSVGSGAEAVAHAASRAGYVVEAALPRLQPNAAFLLLAAQRGDVSPGPLKPLYLRPADAKPQAGKALARTGS